MNPRIENEETCRLAGDLAEPAGESVTGAVTVALRERLARERRRRDVRVRADERLPSRAQPWNRVKRPTVNAICATTAANNPA